MDKDKVTTIQLFEAPKTLTTVYVTFDSHKRKHRRACYFGKVTLNEGQKDQKILRDDCYLLVQNENLHRNNKRQYVEIPKQ